MNMSEDSSSFIEFLLEIGALKFGEFTLKSGRISPYFFNSATFDTGAALERLGYYYALQISRIDPIPTVVFGPAYKGIPLAAAACISLHRDFGIDASYCFDRKEAKAHGDKGLLVGRMPVDGDRIVMVDDVVTDGGTKVEAVENLRKLTPAPVTDIVIALNRQETTASGEDPIARLEADLGVRIHSIAALSGILEFLERGTGFDPALAEKVRKYREQYGIASLRP